MTIPACTTPPINWIRCRDVRFSHLLLRKTKDRWGAVDTSGSGRSINWSQQKRRIHFLAALGATTCVLRKTSGSRMQIPTRPVGAYEYSVRNYASGSLYAQYQGSQCASSTKPPTGKSFTIDALLAKPEDAASDRSSPAHCGVKYHPAATAVPLTGHVGLPIAPAPYVYSPNMMHSAVHAQPGHSVYCCPPFTYQSSCRGAFYAQGKQSYCCTLPEVSARVTSVKSQTTPTRKSD